MRSVELESQRALSFDDGSPVRAASGVAELQDGWLVAQDDAAHAAWVRDGSVTRLRVVPPVDGHDVFSEDAGTKHLKPDFESACSVQHDERPAVLLLGSGSTPARMRASLVTPSGCRVTDLAPLYVRVARVLGLDPADLNLEGACPVDGGLRWFARGNRTAGVPSASVDLDLTALLAAFGGADPWAVGVGRPRTYDLGEVDGVGLMATDAVALDDGRILLSAAAEATDDAVDDGPVVATALALLAGEDGPAVVPLPPVDGRVAKVEGLALLGSSHDDARLLAVADEDDPELPSAELVLRVRWS